MHLIIINLHKSQTDKKIFNFIIKIILTVKDDFHSNFKYLIFLGRMNTLNALYMLNIV